MIAARNCGRGEQMKFWNYVFWSFVRAVITLVIMSFVIAFAMYLWDPEYAYILD
jgi:hypothetical protein